jgi:hypothetical protein
MLAESQGHRELSIEIAENGVKRAIANKDVDKTMAMIRQGADVNIVNEDHWSPLVYICAFSEDLQYVR